MFVIFSTQKHFHTEFVGMPNFMTYIHTKFHVRSTNNSLYTKIKMLLFDMLQKIT
jgi:hypothetical protein